MVNELRVEELDSHFEVPSSLYRFAKYVAEDVWGEGATITVWPAWCRVRFPEIVRSGDQTFARVADRVA